jgi:UDP-4-amino-4,6-dideoxy-N-acetyl-beta-L-altrosamine N-acetyltransferase
MISVRPMNADDRQRLRLWRSAPEVARYLFQGGSSSIASHEAWFRAIPKHSRWIVEYDQVAVATLNLADVDPEHRTANWGFFIADSNYRGRGIGSYCEYWMQQYAFDGLGLFKLWGEILATNGPMLRIHDAFGFRREGLFEAHVVRDGERIDVVRVGMLAEEWQRVRAHNAEILRRKGLSLPDLPANVVWPDTPRTAPSNLSQQLGMSDAEADEFFRKAAIF